MCETIFATSIKWALHHWISLTIGFLQKKESYMCVGVTDTSQDVSYNVSLMFKV